MRKCRGSDCFGRSETRSSLIFLLARRKNFIFLLQLKQTALSSSFRQRPRRRRRIRRRAFGETHRAGKLLRRRISRSMHRVIRRTIVAPMTIQPLASTRGVGFIRVKIRTFCPDSWCRLIAGVIHRQSKIKIKYPVPSTRTVTSPRCVAAACAKSTDWKKNLGRRARTVLEFHGRSAVLRRSRRAIVIVLHLDCINDIPCLQSTWN